MKNKKTKILVPAIALILLSTAASVSGSVAWFTASRTTKVETGKFSVVNTGDQFSVDLVAVAGVNVTNEASNKKVDPKANYSLTDASFDHKYHNEAGFTAEGFEWTAPYVVTPDVPRTGVESVASLNGITESKLERGTNVYSAFVWTMKFNIKFSDSATKDQGLFLDLSSDETYMSEPVAVKDGDNIGGLYKTAQCKEADRFAADTLYEGADTTYYTKPTDTGKGFRIAFIPTAADSQCIGYGKVWADNQGDTDADNKYVDVSDLQNPSLNAVAYNQKTISHNGSAFGEATVSKVMLTSSNNEGVPADNSVTHANALSTKANYLGFFKHNPGNTVSITYTCVAWYEGTHSLVDQNHTLEDIVASMKFGVTNLLAA